MPRGRGRKPTRWLVWHFAYPYGMDFNDADREIDYDHLE